MVSGSHDKTVRIWNLQERKIIAVLEGHTSFVISLAVTPDNQLIVSGSWNQIFVWSISLRKLVAVAEGHVRFISCMAIDCEDKYIVTGSWDKTLRVWDLLQKRQVCVLDGHKSLYAALLLWVILE